MKHRFFGVLIAFSFLFVAAHVQASVVINEIMYDAEGADIDWIELHNDGSAAVDITGWKFGDASSSNHAINIPPANGGQGSMTIPADGYAILAGDASAFLSAHSGFSDIVLDTTMSLTNTAGAVSIRQTSNGAAVDTATYSSDQGASGDGNSLQLVDGTWTPGTPTPDAENSADVGNNDNSDDTTLTDTQDTVSTKNELVVPAFTADIIAPKIIMADIPASFSAFVREKDGGDIKSGTYIWNMGDGTTYTKQGADEFAYTYLYPGDYAVHLEFFDHAHSVPYDPDDTDDLVVHVVGSNVVLSVGSDGGIIITNKNTRDMVLDDFKLEAGGATFTFPKHSILLAGKSVTFSQVRLGLSTGNSVALVTPAGITESTYPPIAATAAPATNQQRVLSYKETADSNQEALVGDAADTIETNPLENKVTDSAPHKTKSLGVWIAIVVVIGLGIGMYFFLGRPTSTEEGFELLDE